MITRFEATASLLSIVIGMLVTLIASVWKARGWVDRLNATDGRLATAIEELTKSQQILHQANQERFAAIERQLAAASARGRPARSRGGSAG